MEGIINSCKGTVVYNIYQGKTDNTYKREHCWWEYDANNSLLTLYNIGKKGAEQVNGKVEGPVATDISIAATIGHLLNIHRDKDIDHIVVSFISIDPVTNQQDKVQKSVDN